MGAISSKIDAAVFAVLNQDATQEEINNVISSTVVVDDDGQGFTASIWFKTSTATEMYLFDNRSGSEGFTAIITSHYP